MIGEKKKTENHDGGREKDGSMEVSNNNDKSIANHWWIEKEHKSVEKESEEERIVLYL